MIRLKTRRTSNAVTKVHPLATLPDLTIEMEWDEPSRAWVTYVKELNGISTHGSTQTEALEETRDMVAGWLDDMRARRYPTGLSSAAVRRIRKALGEPTGRYFPTKDPAYTLKPKTEFGRRLLDARRKIIESGQRLRSVEEILQERDDFRVGRG